MVIITSEKPQDPNQMAEGIDEQFKDKDVEWIASLVQDNGTEKVNDFENSTRCMLYGEYENLRLINDTLHRATEDKNGIIQHQYVLPSHQTKPVIENSTVQYSADT